MSQDKGHIIYCSRCGNEYYSNSRYCMKCGNLNPDHPSNQNMKQYVSAAQEGYRVGSGKVISNVNSNIISKKSDAVMSGDKMGSFTLCFFINFGLFILLSVGIILYYYITLDGDFIAMATSLLCYYLIILTICSLFIYSLQLVFMKMNKPWWAALIPFYNFYVLADAIYGKKSICTLTLIPIVGQVLWIYLLYKLGDCFKKPKIFVLLLPVIMIPLIGFGESSYYGVNYVHKSHTLEQEFKMKRMPLYLASLYIFVSMGVIVYTNTLHLKNEVGQVNAAMFVRASQIVVKNVQNRVERKLVQCSFPDNKIFYLHFDDIASDFKIPFSLVMPKVEAYVKVVPTERPGKYNFYISMTNGKYGFPETFSKEVDINTVINYKKLEKVYDDGNDCYLR